MSILKSTGLGADKARMITLYNRREEFYKEINEWNWNSDKNEIGYNPIWNAEKSKVYTPDEYLFIKQYVLKFGWFDEQFVRKIKNPVKTFGVSFKTIQTVIAKTIGSELTPVIPIDMPKVDFSYIDFK